VSALAGQRDNLPILTWARARIVLARDVRPAITGNEIKHSLICIDAPGPANARRCSGLRNANPVQMARFLRGIAKSLPCAPLMTHHVAGVVHGSGSPVLATGQCARRTLLAPRAGRSGLARRTVRAIATVA